MQYRMQSTLVSKVLRSALFTESECHIDSSSCVAMTWIQVVGFQPPSDEIAP